VTHRISGSLTRSDRRRWALAVGVAVIVAYPFASLSQEVAPSQVTPQTLRPAATNTPGGLLLSGGAGLQAPAGAERLSVIVGRLAIEGAFGGLDRETHAFADSVEGKRVTVARIYELAYALEQAYARAGFVLARVAVPPQKLNDHGTLRIVVVDGFIERVQVDSLPERVRAVVASRMASLVGQRHITLDEIERRLLTAGDVPGLQLRSTLARGATPGGALLVLEGTHQLVTGTVSVDDLLPASLGTWSYGANVALNSPFGFGEQFYASASAGGNPGLIFSPTSPLRVLGAGIVLPLGLDGWTINPEYTYSRTNPKVPIGGLANIGHFSRFALRTSYPLIRTRTQTFILTGAFEYISQSISLPLFDTDLDRDSYGVLRAGAAYESALPWWNETLQASATLSHGTGGRSATDAATSGVPLSRQGAGPLFYKANIDAHVTQPLPEGFRVDLIGRGQTSFGKPLLISEQLSLDGPSAVSAYPSGSLNVDEGGTLRAEMSRPFAIQGFVFPMVLSPYGFGAFGSGLLHDPTVAEVAVVHAGAVGVGIRSDINMPAGYLSPSLGLEVARQFSNLPSLAHAWRVNVSISTRF
jgi:hemolysin activation/secretion protein